MQQRFVGLPEIILKEKRQHAGKQCNDNIEIIIQPEYRGINDNITNGSPSKSCNHTKNNYSKKIHPFFGTSQYSCDRKDSNTCQDYQVIRWEKTGDIHHE